MAKPENIGSPYRKTGTMFPKMFPLAREISGQCTVQLYLTMILFNTVVAQ